MAYDPLVDEAVTKHSATRAALIRGLGLQTAESLAEMFWKEQASGIAESTTLLEMMLMNDGVLQGATFCLSPDISDMIATSSLTMPNETVLHSHVVPAPSGMVIGRAPMPALDFGRGTTTAFVWTTTNFIDPDTKVQHDGLAVLPLEWSDGVFLPSANIGTYYLGVSRIDAGGEHPNPRAWAFIAALFLFMNDRILTTSTRYASRSTQRRIARSQGVDITNVPPAKIIELRKREYQQQAASGETAEREYTCQWIVRGHWRNQWYPSLGINQPKWIAPYTKGPDDKPLKAPQQNVFAVVR